MAGLLPERGNNGKRKYRRMMGTLIPCRLLGEPTIARVDGRLMQTIQVISLNTTRDGTRTYLQEQTIATRYLVGEKIGNQTADQRLTRVEELDGPDGTIKDINELAQEVMDAEDEFQGARSGNDDAALDALNANLLALQQRS